jgi:outer membrane protein assembly factor BamB
LAWTHFEVTKPPDYERWGMVDLDWVDLGKAIDVKPNLVAYAHSYLHCARGGKVRFVVDHYHGLKVWVNGEPLYASAKEAAGYGSHYGISRQKLALVNHHSPEFEMTLNEGWNRLLLKVTSPNVKGWKNLKFAHRLIDPEPVPYEEKNLVWKTKLPERTNACPIVVGDRIFTPAEPDELLCLDKATGKVLWRRFHGFYGATPEAERTANPLFKEIEPLAKALAETMDYEEGLELRRKIRELLLKADKKKYGMKLEGHLSGHFGIVGFTTTPVSDGKHVWAFYGTGVVACYDLDGNRKWIRRLPCEGEISYSCTPALIAGKLVVVFAGMHALDAATGAEVWADPKAHTVASLIPGRIQGVDVVANKAGSIYRAADGKLLWANPHFHTGDTGWAPPTIVDDVFYLLWHGVGGLIVADFTGVEGEDWKPKVRVIGMGANNRRPNGEWLDRWTAGSPLILGDTAYAIDQYGVFYAADLTTSKAIYRHETGFDEMHNYNAIGVGASATLGGEHIYVLDNQGTCVVLEPGPAWKPVALNRIETILQRNWPVNPQEILANGPPVFDGERLYLRGEQYLYCIGEE